MVSETKIDESFPIEGLLRFIIIEGFSVPYRVDQNANGGGIMLFLRKDIFSKLERSLRKRKGYLLAVTIQIEKTYKISLNLEQNLGFIFI